MQEFDYFIVIAYLAGILLLGFYFRKFVGSSEDYFLGGRSLPFWDPFLSILYIINGMENEVNSTQEVKTDKTALINRALGLFILFFGIVVIIAIFFTGTPVGKMTNAEAGGLLCLIGGGMMLKSRRTLRATNSK